MRLIVRCLSTAFLWLTVSHTVCLAQDGLVIKGDTKVVDVERMVIVKEKMTVVSSLPFTVEAPKGGFLYRWSVPGTVTSSSARNVLTVTSAPKGTVTVAVEYAVYNPKNDPPIDERRLELTFGIGEVIPPKPPEPKPDPAPIPADGLHVMIIHETVAKLPFEQKAILQSVIIRDYLATKCPKLADGQTAARFYDYDTDSSGDLKVWQDTFTKYKPTDKTKLPILIVSNGKAGFVGPMPKTVAETLSKIKEFGGE